jgi:hypothetical protein
MNHHIFGIEVDHRTERIPAVQDVLTKFGCNIRLRLGIPEADSVSCSLGGIILIDVFGTPEQVEGCYRELGALPGVALQRMDFLEE